MIPYIMTGKTISLFVNGKMTPVADGHVNYAAILEALKAEEWSKIPDLVDVPAAVRKFSNDRIQVTEEAVYYNGEALDISVTRKMIAMMREGFSIVPLANFLKKLMDNPSKHAVHELYGFLELNGLPIYEDGDFGVIRIVKSDGWDKHTGRTYFHEAGAVLKMPRNFVDDDSRLLCSTGIHCMSPGYASSWYYEGDQVWWCRVNPAHVVAVPSNGREQKMRVCEVKIVEQISIDDIRPRYEQQVVSEKFDDGGPYNEPEPELRKFSFELSGLDEDGDAIIGTITVEDTDRDPAEVFILDVIEETDPDELITWSYASGIDIDVRSYGIDWTTVAIVKPVAKTYDVLAKVNDIEGYYLTTTVRLGAYSPDEAEASCRAELADGAQNYAWAYPPEAGQRNAQIDWGTITTISATEVDEPEVEPAPAVKQFEVKAAAKTYGLLGKTVTTKVVLDAKDSDDAASLFQHVDHGRLQWLSRIKSVIAWSEIDPDTVRVTLITEL